MNSIDLEQWSTAKSAELYGVHDWGAGYFHVSASGELEVRLEVDGQVHTLNLLDAISGIKERGLGMPVVLRVGDILDARIRELHRSFRKAMDEQGYEGEYRGVYPIKVNQQEEVVQHVTSYGKQFHHGLEAGSKAELHAAISFLQDPDACLICNGYKDQEFVDLGLYARKIGINCIFVVEMPGELELILSRAEALNVNPALGVRAKLSTRAGGQWSQSGGDRSVFGLSTTQMMNVIDTLHERDRLDCLKLLHYHIGSQIPNIRDIRSGVQEASRLYRALVEEGVPMEYLDLGGGLAVDYDGSNTNFESSCNYSLEEYCADIVDAVLTTLGDTGIPHPTIITESGRATVAYYSILLFNILDVSRFATTAIPETLPEDSPDILQNMKEALENITSKSVQECFNDAIFYKEEINQLFRHGRLTLRQKATGENMFWHIIAKVAKLTRNMKFVPDEMGGVPEALADIYYGNFSLFQSLPDVWAIDQIFPIMPIHRLNERPNREAILSDITCDCDGKIDRFVDLRDVRRTLPVHELRDGEEYYLGVFLVGAYQETLGDLHNLLGDTNVVTVQFDENGYEFVREHEGDSVSDVLSYVEYDPKAIINRIRNAAETAVRKGMISPQERREIMEAYMDGMRGYTYFER